MQMNRITFWATVPLAYLQAYGQTLTLTRGVTGGAALFRTPFDIFSNFLPTFTIITSMVAGTMLLVWLGEQIQERGIGNGISVIIFAGIVSRLPGLISQALTGAQLGGAEQVIGIIAFLVIGLFTIVGIVLVQEGQRRIPVQYAKRVRGNRVYGGQSSHIPLKVNMSGMIPLIFAQSIIIFPGTIASYGCPEQVAPAGAGILKQVACFTYQTFSPQFGTGTLVYSTLLFLLVVGFTYFYTMVIFNQQNIRRIASAQWWVYPGHPAGQPHRTAQTYHSVPDEDSLPDHAGWRVLPWSGCDSAVLDPVRSPACRSA